MIYIMSIVFPLIAMACSAWVLVAMVCYVMEIQRDIRADKAK